MRNLWEDNMRSLIIFCLAILLLALNCTATAPVQLSGIGGQTILAQVASTNMTTQVTKASSGDLWDWGKIPMNYALNGPGKLLELPSADEDNLWLGGMSKGIELNTDVYT